MDVVNLITSLVENHQIWAYAIMLFGVIIEGEVVGISGGILVHLGALSFPIALICVFCGGLLKTFLGYKLGAYFQRRFKTSKFLMYIEKKVQSAVPRFKEKPFWSIFISKFIIGANHLVILYSGYVGVDYRKYLKAEILATAIWAPIVLSLGYFFSYTALQISRDIWQFSMIVLVLFILFVAFDKLAGEIYEFFAEYKNGKKN